MLAIGQLQIWRYENGDTEPKGEMIARIARFLNVSADYLLGLADEPHGYLELELNEQERRVLAALRKGQKMDAIRTITEG